jgi:hypothetical protein
MTFDPIRVTVAVKRRAINAYFNPGLDILEKSIKKVKTNRVGKPFGLKEIRIAPGINRVPM